MRIGTGGGENQTGKKRIVCWGMIGLAERVGKDEGGIMAPVGEI